MRFQVSSLLEGCAFRRNFCRILSTLFFLISKKKMPEKRNNWKFELSMFCPLLIFQNFQKRQIVYLEITKTNVENFDKTIFDKHGPWKLD